MDWNVAEQISGTLQHGIGSIAIVIGGAWAYFRFARFRTLHPRVEFYFECNRTDVDTSHVLVILTLRLTNRGQTRVQLRKREHSRCFLKYALIANIDSAYQLAPLTVSSKELEHLDSCFELHRWVEPGETIDDVKVLKVNKSGMLALQIELVVFGLKKWSASAAFPLIGQVEKSSFKSEDEQDEYEEAEALREGLRSILAKIGQLDEIQRTTFQDLVDEINALLRESNSSSSFERRANELSTRGEKALCVDRWPPN